MRCNRVPVQVSADGLMSAGSPSCRGRSTSAQVWQAARQQRPLARRAQIAALLFVALLAGCASTAPLHQLQGAALGSTWSVKIAGAPGIDSAAVHRGIQQQIDEVENQLSRWNSTSALSILNAATDSDWQPLPANVQKALTYALHLAADTAGAYDPTVAPLVDIWGFGRQGRRYAPPSADEISTARARVGWTKIELDPAANRVRRPPGVVLDLSSMTHGLAADRVAAYLRAQGVTRYLVDVGSELRAQGDAPEGQPWRVAIERPPAELTASLSSSAGFGSNANVESNGASTPIRTVALRDAGIATSGNYRYFFDYDGRRYSHRIDPRTGAPVTHALASVTVIHPECMHADALATALTVLGTDEGLEYARRHDIAALFIVRTAQGLEERMTSTFESYLR
jgi:thiamine biosynthesis lipoprotein